MLLINAKILTCKKEVWENGYILVQDGIIEALGDMQNVPHTSEEIIDLKGKCITPGFIDSHSHLGLWENGLTFEGEDGNEDTDPVTPHIRVCDGINPLDRSFTEALEAGVTTVVVAPGSANPIGGQISALKTYGRCIDKMLLRPLVGFKMALGENPKGTYNQKNQSPVTRMATAAFIREYLSKAKKYADDKLLSQTDEDVEEPELDVKLEALSKLFGEDKVKVHIHAHRADDIFTAIRLCKEFDLEYVLVHCTDGHIIAPELQQESSRIIVGPVIGDRGKPELVNHSVENAAVLYRQGLQIAIATDHPELPVQYLPLSAALCIHAGLPYMAALEAITIRAAEMAGIEKRVGSLETGKDADILVFDGDPLSGFNKPLMVFVNGQRVVKQENKDKV